MEVLIFAALCMCLTVIAIMARINLLRFLGYANAVDVGFSVAMLALFASTFSGVVASALAGLLMTGMLSVLRNLIGYERLTRAGWVYTPPKWDIKGLRDRLVHNMGMNYA